MQDQYNKQLIDEVDNDCRIPVIKDLIDNGADVNSRIYTDGDNKFLPIIISAVFNNTEELLYLLVDNGANPNAIDSEGYTPLMYAVMYGKLEMVEYLLNHGADINMRGSDKSSPILVSAKTGDLDRLSENELERIYGFDESEIKYIKGEYGVKRARITELLLERGCDYIDDYHTLIETKFNNSDSFNMIRMHHFKKLYPNSSSEVLVELNKLVHDFVDHSTNVEWYESRCAHNQGVLSVIEYVLKYDIEVRGHQMDLELYLKIITLYLSAKSHERVDMALEALAVLSYYYTKVSPDSNQINKLHKFCNSLPLATLNCDFDSDILNKYIKP